MKSDFNFSFIS